MLDTMVGEYWLLDLVWYFVISAFLGWLVEVVYQWIKVGHFVNRGFLLGPFCPIYGFGVVMILLGTSFAGLVDMSLTFFLFFRLFVLVVFLSTLLEFVVGALLMLFFGQRWWDYSHLRYNIKGFISLRFSLYWGLGGSLFYLMLDGLALNRGLFLPRPLFEYLTIGMLVYLVADVTKSVDLAIRLRWFASELYEAARDLKERLEDVAEIDLDFLRVEALIRKGQLNEFVDEFFERFSKLAKEQRVLISRAMVRYDALLSSSRVLQFRHIFHAFPSIRDIRYAGILDVLRERMNGVVHRNGKSSWPEKPEDDPNEDV